MELFVELETLKLVASQNDRREKPSITIKRGDALPLTVRFLQAQAPTRLDATTTISFALKESGKYDATPVVLEQTFTASTVGSPDSDPHYTATPSLNTTELNALFSIDGNSANDPASVTLMGEITWTATGDTGPTSIKTFTVNCENDVYRGTESAPSSQPSPDDWLASRGILPIRTGATHVWPAALTLEGEILDDSNNPLTLLNLAFVSVGNSRPTYSVNLADGTSLDLSWSSGDWELEVDSNSISTILQYIGTSDKKDPTDIVLLGSGGRSNLTLRDSSGKIAPQIGNLARFTDSNQTHIWTGTDYSAI
jgi:hypothetical protein